MPTLLTLERPLPPLPSRRSSIIIPTILHDERHLDSLTDLSPFLFSYPLSLLLPVEQPHSMDIQQAQEALKKFRLGKYALPQGITPGTNPQAEHLYHMTQALRDASGGTPIVQALAQIPAYQQALVQQTIPTEKFAQVNTILAQLERREMNESQAASALRQLATTPVTSQLGQLSQNLSFPSASRQEREAQISAAGPRIQAWQDRTAQNSGVSLDKVKSVFKSFSDEQLAAVEASDQTRVIKSGGGGGKTDVVVAMITDAVVNRGARATDFTVLVATHSAEGELVRRLTDIGNVIPAMKLDWAGQVKTFHSKAMSVLNQRVMQASGQAMTPLQAMGMGAYTPFPSSSSSRRAAPKNAEEAFRAQTQEEFKYFQNLLTHHGVRVQQSANLFQQIQAIKAEHGYDGIYKDMGIRGAQSWASGKKDAFESLLYMYEKARMNDPQFKLPSQTGPHYDLADSIILAARAGERGKTTPWKNTVVDEMQDPNRQMYRLLAAQTQKSSGFRFFAGDEGQRTIKSGGGYQAGQAIQHMFPSAKAFPLIGNYRLGPINTALYSATQMEHVLDNRGRAPFQISMRQGGTEAFPSMYTAQSFKQVNEQMFADYLKQQGLSHGHIESNIQAGVHPLSGAASADSMPFVFQMKEQRRYFLKTIEHQLSQKFGPAKAKVAVRQMFNLGTPQGTGGNQAYALLVNQTLGKSFPHVFADWTRVGSKWSDADYMEQMGVVASRPTVQSHIYSSQTNIAGSNYNLTPDTLHGQAVPTGMATLYQWMLHNLTGVQGMSPSSLSAADQQLLASPMASRVQAPARDLSSFQGFVEDTIKLIPHSRPAAGAGIGTSAVHSATSVGVTSSSERFGDESTTVNGISDRGSFQRILGTAKPEPDMTRIGLIVGYARNLLQQGGEVTEDIESLMKSGMFGYLSGGEKKAANKQITDYMAETTSDDWSPYFNEKSRLMSGDHDRYSYRGSDERTLRQGISDFLGSDLVRQHPQIKPLIEGAFTRESVRNVVADPKNAPNTYERQIFTQSPVLKTIQDYAYAQRSDAGQHLLQQVNAAHEQGGLDPFIRNLVNNPKDDMLREEILNKAADVVSYGYLPPEAIEAIKSAAQEFDHQKLINLIDAYGDTLYSADNSQVGLRPVDMDYIKANHPREHALLSALAEKSGVDLSNLEDPAVQKQLSMLPHVVGQMVRSAGASGQSLGIPIAESAFAPFTTEMSALSHNLEKAGILDPMAVRALGTSGPDLLEMTALPMRKLSPSRVPNTGQLAPFIAQNSLFGNTISPEEEQAMGMSFQSEGVGVGLEGYQKRLENLLSIQGHKLSPEQAQGYRTELEQVRGLRKTLGDPSFHLESGHLLNMVHRAATGESAIDKNVKGEHNQPYARFMAPLKNQFGEGNRTLGSIQELVSSLQEGIGHVQGTGTLSRTHTNRILEALGHDPGEFGTLSDLENLAGFGEGSSIPLTALAGQFPSEQENLLAQFTRFPFKQGQTVAFMGGMPGFTDIAPLGQEKAGLQAGMVGTLHPINKGISFGLPTDYGDFRKHGLYTQDEWKEHGPHAKDPEFLKKIAEPLAMLHTRNRKGEIQKFPVRLSQVSDLYAKGLHPDSQEMLDISRHNVLSGDIKGAISRRKQASSKVPAWLATKRGQRYQARVAKQNELPIGTTASKRPTPVSRGFTRLSRGAPWITTRDTRMLHPRPDLNVPPAHIPMDEQDRKMYRNQLELRSKLFAPRERRLIGRLYGGIVPGQQYNPYPSKAPRAQFDPWLQRATQRSLPFGASGSGYDTILGQQARGEEWLENIASGKKPAELAALQAVHEQRFARVVMPPKLPGIPFASANGGSASALSPSLRAQIEGGGGANETEKFALVSNTPPQEAFMPEGFVGGSLGAASPFAQGPILGDANQQRIVRNLQNIVPGQLKGLSPNALGEWIQVKEGLLRQSLRDVREQGRPLDLAAAFLDAFSIQAAQQKSGWVSPLHPALAAYARQITHPFLQQRLSQFPPAKDSPEGQLKEGESYLRVLHKGWRDNYGNTVYGSPDEIQKQEALVASLKQQLAGGSPPPQEAPPVPPSPPPQQQPTLPSSWESSVVEHLTPNQVDALKKVLSPEELEGIEKIRGSYPEVKRKLQEAKWFYGPGTPDAFGYNEAGVQGYKGALQHTYHAFYEPKPEDDIFKAPKGPWHSARQVVEHHEQLKIANQLLADFASPPQSASPDLAAQLDKQMDFLSSMQEDELISPEDIRKQAAIVENLKSQLKGGSPPPEAASVPPSSLPVHSPGYSVSDKEALQSVQRANQFPPQEPLLSPPSQLDPIEKLHQALLRNPDKQPYAGSIAPDTQTSAPPPSLPEPLPADQLEALATGLREGNSNWGIHPPSEEQKKYMLDPARRTVLEGGPGTGKTATAVRGQMYQVATGQLLPKNVLALSAIRSATGRLAGEFGKYRKLLPSGKEYSFMKPRTFASVAASTVLHQEHDENNQPYFPVLQKLGYKSLTGEVLGDPTSEDLYGKDEATQMKMMGIGQRAFIREQINASLTASGKRPWTEQQIKNAQKYIGDIKKGRMSGYGAYESIAKGEKVLEEPYTQAITQGMRNLQSGNMTHEAALVLHEQGMRRKGGMDWDDLFSIANEAYQKFGPDALPQIFKHIEGILIDEGQDVTPIMASLQKGFIGALSANNPRVTVAMDVMQSLTQGMGGVPMEKVRDSYRDILGIPEGTPFHALTQNFRSDAGVVAFHRALLASRHLQNTPQSPPQVARSGKVGLPMQHIVTATQPDEYRQMFHKMLGDTGVSHSQIKENIKKGLHPLSGATLAPKEIAFIASRNQDTKLFEHIAKKELATTLGLQPPEASHVFEQIMRHGMPPVGLSEESDEWKAAQYQMPLLKFMGSRGNEYQRVYTDVSFTGQWQHSNDVEGHARNLNVGLTRTSAGGQTTVGAAEFPFTNDEGEKYMAGKLNLSNPAVMEKMTRRSRKNAPEEYQGKPVPRFFRDLHQSAQEFLKQWKYIPNVTQQATPSHTLPKEQLVPSSGLSEAWEQLKSQDPAKHAELSTFFQNYPGKLQAGFERQTHTGSPKEYLQQISTLAKSGYERAKSEGNIYGMVKSGEQHARAENLLSTPDSFSTWKQGAPAQSQNVQVDAKSATINIPSGGSVSITGTPGSSTLVPPSSGVTPVKTSTPPPPGSRFAPPPSGPPLPPLSGRGYTNNPLGGPPPATPQVSPPGPGGSPPSGGSGGSGGGGWNNAASQFGRSMARLGYELQFMGKYLGDIVTQALQQGSEYRMATGGLPGSGSTGTKGFYNFSSSTGITAYQQKTLPMYSTTQVAQGINSLYATTGYRGTSPPLGAATDMMGLAAITGIDPTELMGNIAYLSGSSGQGQNMGSYGNMTGMLGNLFGNVLTGANVTPTLSALSSIVPTLNGIAPGGGSQTGQAMAFFQLAQNAGMTPQNFGDVSSLMGSLTGIGTAPNLQQQYTLQKLGYPLTADTALTQYQQEQTSRDMQIASLGLQQNINEGVAGINGGQSTGSPLSLPQLQIQVDQAQITMDKANLTMSGIQLQAAQVGQQGAELQYQYGQASYNFNLAQQNALYGPIGKDSSQLAGYSFQQNQLVAQRNSTSPEVGTMFTPQNVSGLRNQEFYAGLQNQQQSLILGRSPLLSDALFQQQMKYIAQQADYYKQELALRNQQREFDMVWQKRLLDQQGAQVAAQGRIVAYQGYIYSLQQSQFHLEVEKNLYDQKQAAIAQQFLARQAGDLEAINASMNQFLNGQGPVGGQNLQPQDLVQRMADELKSGKLNPSTLQSTIRGLGLSPQDQSTMYQLVVQLSKSHETLGQMTKNMNNAGDKQVVDLFNKLKKDGAFNINVQQAGQQNASLQTGGTDEIWRQLTQNTKDLALSESNIAKVLAPNTPFVQDIATIANLLGPVAVGVGTLANIIGLWMKFGGGPGGGGAGGGAIAGGGLLGPLVAAGLEVVGGWGSFNPKKAAAVPWAQALIGPGVLAGYGLHQGFNALQDPKGQALAFRQMAGGVGDWFKKDPLNLSKITDDVEKFLGIGSGSKKGQGLLPSLWNGVKNDVELFLGIGGNTHKQGLLPFSINSVMDDIEKFLGVGSGSKKGQGIIPFVLNNMVDDVELFLGVGSGSKKGEGIIPYVLNNLVDDTERFLGVGSGSKKGEGIIPYVLNNLVDDTEAYLGLGSAAKKGQGLIPDLFNGLITDIKNWLGLNAKTGSGGFLGDLFRNIFGGNGNNTGGGEGSIPGPSGAPPGFDTPHVNTQFGQKMWYGTHQGIDFAADQGTPLAAFNSGKVTNTGFFPWGGEVDVDMGGGLTERYLHLSAIAASKGQNVRTGQFLGLTGGGTPQSGFGYWSRGPHSHVQVDMGNINRGINPWPIWALTGATDIKRFYGISTMDAGAGAHGGAGGARQLAEGGIAMKRVIAEIGEGKEPEAVLPLSRLSNLLKAASSTQTPGTVAQPTKAIQVSKLADKFEIHVHTTASKLDDQAIDDLGAQFFDILTTELQKL